MLEHDWKTIPTVYSTIVEKEPIPVVGVRARGIRRMLRERITRRRAVRLLDAIFPTGQVDRLADPSVTRVVAEDLADAASLHLLLWNGIRVEARIDLGSVQYDVHVLTSSGWSSSGWLGAGAAREWMAFQTPIPAA